MQTSRREKMPIEQHIVSVRIPEGMEVGKIREHRSLPNSIVIEFEDKLYNKIKYKLALFDGEELLIALNDSDIRRIGNYSGFVKWIHTEWQEVEI